MPATPAASRNQNGLIRVNASEAVATMVSATAPGERSAPSASV
jgi:hypothetical protein